jgi:hypothetical protein
MHAEHTDQCWHFDVARYPLAGGAGAEILVVVDAYTRDVLCVSAHNQVTRPGVAATFRAACSRHGIPASVVIDRSILLNGGPASGGRGRIGLDADLRRLGTAQKKTEVVCPQDKGIAERFLQALTRWLAARPSQPARLTQLQAVLDTFTASYNHQHRRPSPRQVAAPEHVDHGATSGRLRKSARST